MSISTKKNVNKARALLFLKGMAMGAADSVPGVSGGTIAFITGIYEELINSIKRINLPALRVLFKQGPLATWQYINGSFLLTLVLGIFTSLILFANTVEFLLEHHRPLLMSFFVGLILASCWIMFLEIKTWSIKTGVLFLLGLGFSVGLTLAPAGNYELSLLYIFFCGALAICAMILPGISGAFILILLGAYEPILAAVTEFDILTLIVFLAGCVSGLMAFSNVLAYLFSRFRVQTLSLLLGVLLGSLYTIWPWRIVETNNSGADVSLLFFIVLALSGFLFVYVLERFANK